MLPLHREEGFLWGKLFFKDICLLLTIVVSHLSHKLLFLDFTYLVSKLCCCTQIHSQ